jgi:acyl-coenzyme A thioesterase PaaI-like protein
MNRLLSLWQRCANKPLGKAIFGRLISWQAPYFATIAPRFEVFEAGHVRVSMRKRRAVQNHIATIHAIALCNLAELAAGTMMEASLPSNMRWLPKGMQVDYLAKAESDVVAECRLPEFPTDQASDLPITVEIVDTHGKLVCRAIITMYISPRRRKPE